MSVVNIFRFANAAMIWTDGGHWDAEGRLASIGTKIGFLPHLNAAVVVRGSAVLPIIVHELGHRFATFDAMVADARESITDAVTSYEAESGAWFSDYEAFLIGWSEARRVPEVYHVREGQGGPLEPFDNQVILAPNNGVWGQISAEVPDILSGALANYKVGLRIMELQRKLRINGIGGCAGFAQVTTIGPASIETRIVKRWPYLIAEDAGR